MNPLYRQVVETYVEGPGLKLKSAPLGDGLTDVDALRKALSKHVAAVVIQYPNFFGCLEDVRGIADIAHESLPSPCPVAACRNAGRMRQHGVPTAST